MDQFIRHVAINLYFSEHMFNDDVIVRKENLTSAGINYQQNLLGSLSVLIDMRVHYFQIYH